MTRKRQDLLLHKPSAIPGPECDIHMQAGAPEGRGDIGRVLQRTGDNGNLRELWWLRCPWCRELLELDAAQLHMEAGLLRYGATIHCDTCTSDYEITAGEAVKSGAGGTARAIVGTPDGSTERGSSEHHAS